MRCPGQGACSARPRRLQCGREYPAGQKSALRLSQRPKRWESAPRPIGAQSVRAAEAHALNVIPCATWRQKAPVEPLGTILDQLERSSGETRNESETERHVGPALVSRRHLFEWK